MKNVLIVGTAEDWSSYFDENYNILNFGHDSINLNLNNGKLFLSNPFNKEIHAVLWRVGANTRTWKYTNSLELIRASNVFCMNSAQSLLNINTRMGMLSRLKAISNLNVIDFVGFVASKIDIDKIPFDFPYVAKLGNFHCMRHKYLIKNKLDIEKVNREIKNRKEPVIFEPFIKNNSLSHRYLVIGDNVLCSELKGKDWMSNDVEYDKEIRPDERLAKEVIAIAKKLGMDIAGFDFIFDETGKEYLIEVNEDPGFENHTNAFELATKLFLNKIKN